VRSSALAVVVLVGAFALLGYMGARLSEKQALLDKAGPPPPAVQLADEKKAVAPSERNSELRAARSPADTAKSVAEPAHASAHTPLAVAPPLPPNESGKRKVMRSCAPYESRP
jgi:hypothetical protein